MKVALRLTGVGIGELAVAIVRQGHISAAAVVELFHPRNVGSDRISVLDADDRDAQVLLMQSENFSGRQRQADPVGSDVFGKAMDGVEFRESLPVGIVIRLWRQRALAD